MLENALMLQFATTVAFLGMDLSLLFLFILLSMLFFDVFLSLGFVCEFRRGGEDFETKEE